MRWSQTYIPTLREAPSEAELISHNLLLRGGFIRKLASGVYVYLPLMQRVIAKFAKIVREEMDAAGSLELTMPALAPAEVWQKSGRYETAGREQMRLKDRHLREMVLNGTHEEVITEITTGELRSYRQLPVNFYQIQVKFRDEIRPRFGLLRGREFIMKDAYSFDADVASHRISYQKMVDAYFRIFKRAGLDVRMVESDTGAMGGEAAHEFMLLVDTSAGEETILFSDSGEYAANVEKATFREAKPPTQDEDLCPLGKVSTPGVTTIDEVSAFLKVATQRFIKTLIYSADGKPVVALVRGDRTLNETKLKNLIGCNELEMASEEIVKRITGAPLGFAGPVGLAAEAPIYADTMVSSLRNAVVGANSPDTHLQNANAGRDFQVTKVGDIVSAMEGDLSPVDEGILRIRKGIEVGNTFMLGTKYSKSMNATFLDSDGKEQHFVMGSYGIGVTRTPQSAIERYHDGKGIVWPKNIAPYSVEIVPFNFDDQSIREAADRIYDELTAAGLDVLLDDRNERAGVKLNDADLIGCPLRVGIGQKSLKDGKIEIKPRSSTEVHIVPIEQATASVLQLLGSLN